jgi:hypothetical protein
MTESFEKAVGKWPTGNEASLPPDFLAVYQTWLGFIVPTLRASLGDSPVAFTTPNRQTKPGRARDLTLSCTPFPVGTASPPAVLLQQQIVDFGEEDPGGSEASDQEDEGGAGEIAALKATLLKLVGDNKSQQIAIEKLMLQQAALQDDKEATSTYPICSTTAARIPTSFRSLNPMSRTDRRRLRRDHSGTFPEDCIPRELQLPDDIRSHKEVASAKLTLVALTKDIIGPAMAGNLETMRMVGTVHSRLHDLHEEMQSHAEEGDDIVVKAIEVVEAVEPILGAATASLELVLDLHARLRTTVTSRVERAMGFVDLHEDPDKRAKETFLSDDFQAKIEQKAKDKAHMAWASGKVGGGPPRSSLHGQPPPNKSRGGGNSRQRSIQNTGGGGGRGNKKYGDRSKSGGGRGKGGGKGHDKDKSQSSSSEK